jgi:predicted amidohydrolase YtcJ
MITRRQFLKAGAAAGTGCHLGLRTAGAQEGEVDLILTNGRFATLHRAKPTVAAVAIKDGRFVVVGSNEELASLRAKHRIDLRGRTVIPGLNDSHIHLIRGGLNYNMELRWDGVPSLADGLRMLREQAARTPAPQWVRIVGGWSEFQFSERRMPTLDEINTAAPDTPVFILHLYCRALLNRAALRACGYAKDTPEPPGGEIQRDKSGNPTGMLIARPNATILYKTLAMGPKLAPEDQANSTRHFMRELNRLGVTSVIDAGGGSQTYPDDYHIIEQLHRDGLMTVRIAYNLFTQRPKEEKADFARWIKMISPGQGDDLYRMNGAGEMLVFSASDFEDFLEPRPDLPAAMESELRNVIALLARNRWPFRLHATYDASIGRALDVFEQVHRDSPLTDLHWFFDHAETISDRNIERVRALGGGIAVQHRMAYQGEYFLARYGKEAGARTPPIRRMIELGVPTGAGTDATRVAGHNPFLSLYWLVSGRTLGGTVLYPDANRLDRTEALRLYTSGSAWFSGEQERKGTIAPGQLADIAVLTGDFFSVPEDEIRSLESVLTIVGGKAVYGAGEFAAAAPKPPPAAPDWSPVLKFGGYGAPLFLKQAANAHRQPHALEAALKPAGGFFGLGCDCFAF